MSYWSNVDDIGYSNVKIDEHVVEHEVFDQISGDRVFIKL